jgi:hypothetical protein
VIKHLLGKHRAGNVPLNSYMTSHTVAIERLYSVFARYPKPLRLDSSPVRNANDILADLTSSPLRTLSGEKFEGYATFAMTTAGSLEVYKHFLPRILELSIADDYPPYGLEPETIANKLIYGNFFGWLADERDAVLTFMRSAFLFACQQRIMTSSAGEWLIAIARMGIALDFVSNPSFPLTPVAKLNRALAIKALLSWLDIPPEDVSGTCNIAAKEWVLNSDTEAMLLAGMPYTNEVYAWELENAFDELQKMRTSSKSNDICTR